jgi:hypothetical protein
MKTKQNNLFEGGRDEWEGTDAYRDKVIRIIKAVTDEYSVKLLNETNWFKRLRLKLRRKIEIKRKIDELSSSGNLHITGILPF